MPPIANKRKTVVRKKSHELHQELSSHKYLQMKKAVEELVRSGMSWAEAEKKVFGEFFKKYQK